MSKGKSILKDFCSINKVYDPETRKIITRWVLLLPGAGCSWAKKTGGCSMCNFLNATNKVTRGKLFPSYVFTLLYRIGFLLVRHHKPYIVTIYNGGSFLNDQEIPEKAQEKICQLVAQNSFIQKLAIESRPEFVTRSKIRQLTSILGNKRLVVGIGLECVTDTIRLHYVNKGFSIEQFEKAVEILKSNNANILTYVLLKPPYLTEQEAIDEAVKSIKYAFAVGSDEVALESAFIVPGTKMEELFQRNAYRPPWLWSILEVVKQTSHLGNLYLGSFEDNPPPIAIPYNCKKCSSLIMDMMKQYNLAPTTQFFSSTDCECKEQWEQEVLQAAFFKKRIQA